MEDALAAVNREPSAHVEVEKSVVKTNKGGAFSAGSTFYMTDKTGSNEERIKKFLGYGGSKKACEISKGRALLLPNASDTTGFHSTWSRWLKKRFHVKQSYATWFVITLI